MKKRLLLLFLAALTLFVLANKKTSAQSSTNSIAAYIGFDNLHLADEHATPVIFRGTGIVPSIEFRHKGPKTFHLIEGSFISTDLSATSENYGTEILGGDLRYCFLVPFNRGWREKKTIISAGASVSSTFMKSDYRILPVSSWIKGIESWYGNHSIELTAEISYYFTTRDHFRTGLFLPLISNISRPAYSPSGDYDYERNDWDVKMFGKTSIIKDNFHISVDMGWERTITKRLDIAACFEFRYAQCQEPDLIRWYSNSVRFGLSYNFIKKVE